MNNNQFDICIIGAGVIGLAIAERLSNLYKNIIVVEKESSFGQHISSRNSEVIHSGFYYPSSSLKAKLCVDGNNKIYNFVKKYNINYKNCGKLIVAHSSKDEEKLLKLRKQSLDNGVKGVKLLSANESKTIEPRVKCLSSLWIPTAGILDTHGFMSKLENLSISKGVSFAYKTKLNSIHKISSKYKLSFKNTDEYIYSTIVINTAGLWSSEISKMLNLSNYKLEYYKGDYYKCKNLRDLNCLIYPIPQLKSLGIHAVLHLNGEVSFGPNVYKVDKIDYNVDEKFKETFIREINHYIDVSTKDIYVDFSGIRPKIKYDGKFNDFIINNEVENSFKNFINLIGIDSPGLTSSLAIAKYVESIII